MSEVAEFHFKLDIPPSVNNNKWVNPHTGRIHHKDTVRKWKVDADLLLKHIQAQEASDWCVELYFVFHYVKTPRRVDTDNRLKPIFDALAKRLNIDDSRLCQYFVKKELRQGKERDFVEGFVTLL